MKYSTRSKRIISDDEFDEILNTKLDMDLENEKTYYIEDDNQDDFICYCLLENCICKDYDSDDEIKSPYKKFLKKFLKMISGGCFLESISVKELKKKFTETQMNNFIEKLEDVEKSLNVENIPSIIDILEADFDIDKKKQLVQHLICLNTENIPTALYDFSLNELRKSFKDLDDAKYPYWKSEKNNNIQVLEQKIINDLNNNSNLKDQILNSEMSYENKVLAYSRYLKMDETNKFYNWLEILLRIPFNKYCNVDRPIDEIRNVLDSEISFMENPKDKIINILAKMKKSPNSPINAIGIYGSYGSGKTEFCKSLAKALQRPFFQFSLGGDSDSSSLLGFSLTYTGSIPGRIIDCLVKGNVMNPIIFFDECDKLANNNNGYDIIGSLIHLIDTTSNSKWNQDKYFAGIEFDLSKILFIFAFNDPSRVDKILLDRMHKIKVDDYSFNEKLHIVKNNILPKLLEEYKLTGITVSDDALRYITSLASKHEGMRTVKHYLNNVISRINLLKTVNSNTIKFDYRNLKEYYQNSCDVIVQKNHIDILLDKTIIKEDDFPMHMYI